MLFGYLTLLTALILSLSAAVYSILGLTAIFAAAFWPIVVLGGSLEIGKIVTTLWLHKYWTRAELQYKLYLSSAVVILMVLTSMGVFGFLSKAHLDQAVPSGDIQAQVQIFDDKIQTQKDNIKTARTALSQMDTAVDQVMGRSSDEKGADKAVAIRRSQARERGNLQNDIAKAQTEITKLQEQRAPIASQARVVEAEVGPIKYIAALIYGDDPDANILEKAVRWVIILIVVVFDPLALTLLLAATKTFEWERNIDLFNGKKKEDEQYEADDEPLTDDQFDQIKSWVAPVGDEPVFEREEIPLEEPVIQEVKQTATENKDPQPPVTEEPVPESVPKIALHQAETGDTISIVGDDYIEVNGKRIHHKAFDPRSTDASHAAERYIEQTQNQYDLGLEADNMPNSVTGTMRGFGTSFPATPPVKGDMFLRVDQLPSVLYKFNGNVWIEVDKALSDQHAYDSAYIDHLIEKISTGEYDPDLLSDAERDSIEQRLNDKRV